MKKHNIFYLLFFSLFIGCTDESLNISRIDRANNAPPASVIGIDDELEAKKGIGMAYREQTWSSRIARLKPFWHYSWNRQLRDEIPDSVEYVPMFWGSGSVNDEEINKVKELVNAGAVKNILGFNEPDLVSQANMTVDEAIALWPKLESIGVPLGSPVVASNQGAWLDEFMIKAQENNLRVDFICIHI